jgi:ABC-type transport system involved in cytochrome c biogenesis ATPase subunit
MHAIDAHLNAGGLAVVATHLPLSLSGAQELRLGQSAEAA